jgi:AcrR family transcriptional regulator
MRYSQDHKAQTHQRIIKEASARFRRDGIGATGLQPLMKALGLTHGGFYSHFKSKDELVEKALQAAGDEADIVCAELFAQDRPLDAFIDAYLSQWHQTCPEEAAHCPRCHRSSACAGSRVRLQMRCSMRDFDKSRTPLKATIRKNAALSSCPRWSGRCCFRCVENPELARQILDVTRVTKQSQG